jgi:hypothetical protein
MKYRKDVSGQKIFYPETAEQAIPPCYGMKNTAASYRSLSVTQPKLKIFLPAESVVHGSADANHVSSLRQSAKPGLPTSKRTEQNAVRPSVRLSSFRLYPAFSLSPTPVYSLPPTLHHVYYSAVHHSALFAWLFCPHTV